MKDLTGKKFGRLLALRKKLDGLSSRYTKWVCQCDCGMVCDVSYPGLVRKNHARSCGCLTKEIVSKMFSTHKRSKTKTYEIWAGIKKRCLDKNCNNFDNYGGRGITVCDRWLIFENFLEDMGEIPLDKYSIGRIDNDKGYFRENCQWETRKQQCRNRRSNVNINFRGKTQTLKEWCEELDLIYSMVLRRLYANWRIEHAFTISSGDYETINKLKEQSLLLNA